MKARVVEPWLLHPVERFVGESGARLTLVMTPAGQVLAQFGFTRAVEVMSAAALGARIMASTAELARTKGLASLGPVAHQGREQGVLLAPFQMPRGSWVVLVVFGRETTVGLVQLFLGRLAGQLRDAAPAPAIAAPLLAERFEDELNASARDERGRGERREAARREARRRASAGAAAGTAATA